MLNRRLFITGCAACAAFRGSALAQGLPKTCALSAGFHTDGFRTVSSSGDRRLDDALIAELKKINQVYGIRPGYKYIVDTESPNAFAQPDSIVPNTRGTVYFGINLIRTELEGEFGGAAVAGIAAHEGAHILQFFSPWVPLLRRGGTAREMELHADFMAGYYFASTGRTERSVVAFSRSLEAVGDVDFTDPNHHGTGAERLRAMEVGYGLVAQGFDLDAAAQKGIQHVTA